jgi:hypothetical protein
MCRKATIQSLNQPAYVTMWELCPVDPSSVCRFVAVDACFWPGLRECGGTGN